MNINRRNILKGGALAAALGGMGGMSIRQAAAKTSWKLQSFYGSSTDVQHNVLIKDIAQVTGGKLDISLFRGGDVVPNGEMLSALDTGILNFVHGYGGYWPNQIDIGILESGFPGAWHSLEEARYKIYAKGGIDLLKEAYDEQGAVYLDMIFGHEYDLLTTKPVNSLDDLKKMKIRASATMAEILQENGVSTVYLATEELYTGLSSGTIDGLIFGNIFDYYSMNLHEVAKHYTRLNLVYPSVTENMLVSKASWGKLSEEEQAGVRLATETFSVKFRDWLVDNSIEVEEKGVFEVAELPKDDSAQLLKTARTLAEKEGAKSARAKKFFDILFAS